MSRFRKSFSHYRKESIVSSPEIRILISLKEVIKTGDLPAALSLEIRNWKSRLNPFLSLAARSQTAIQSSNCRQLYVTIFYKPFRVMRFPKFY